MLDKIIINNFKLFEKVDIDLSDSVVFIGPNNSGKTSVLQALTLWDFGLQQWLAKRGNDKTPDNRPGVAINRRDLFTIPVPTANLLWKDTHTRTVSRRNGKQVTGNIRIDILVEGHHDQGDWKCGLEFDYTNEESFYCRPLRVDDSKHPKRMSIPELSSRMKIAYLPPMSGLSDREFIKQDGEIGSLIGQGQTAQVLRNMCYNVYMSSEDNWDHLVQNIHQLFGVDILPPELYSNGSEIVMSYKEASGKKLDLACSGRGLQQTLLLIAHIYANPNSVLLLDEPDAHLEILRQRQIFNLLLNVASKYNSQIIAASHSEVILNEATDRSAVVAFVGKPHRIDLKNTQVLKALRDIGFDQYLQAEQTGWVLYLESATDFAILKAFAEKLNHPIQEVLQRPFIHYVSCNLPQIARDHFFGLREGKKNLVGVALFDRLEKELNANAKLTEIMWKKREIENYIYTKDSLLKCIEKFSLGDLFFQGDVQVMEECILELEKAFKVSRKPDPWGSDVKSSDEFLDVLFNNYSSKLNRPLLLRKANYYKLVQYLDVDEIDPEVNEKLDLILKISLQAKPEGMK